MHAQTTVTILRGFSGVSGSSCIVPYAPGIYSTFNAFENRRLSFLNFLPEGRDVTLKRMTDLKSMAFAHKKMCGDLDEERRFRVIVCLDFNNGRFCIFFDTFSYRLVR